MDTNAARLRFPCGLTQAPHSLRFGMDTLLLASFAHAESPHTVQEVCELGCGCAATLIALALLRPELNGMGLEREEQSVHAAQNNLFALGLADRLSILCQDLTSREAIEPFRNHFGAVLANPPYYSSDEGRTSPHLLRNTAMRSSSSLANFLHAASCLLAHHGHFFCIYPAYKIQTVLTQLAQHSLGLRTLLPLQAQSDKGALRILIHARKNCQSDCDLRSPLVLHKAGGELTDEVRSFCPWLAKSAQR